MRYIICILVLFFGFIFTINAHDTSEPHAEPLESYGDVVIDSSVQEQLDMPELLKKDISIIMNNQKVTNINDINKEQISDADLEMLGDVLLEISNPGKGHAEIHKQNGGEGSEQLRIFHIDTAKSYLGLKTSYNYNKMNEEYEYTVNTTSTDKNNIIEPQSKDIKNYLFVILTVVLLIIFLFKLPIKTK